MGAYHQVYPMLLLQQFSDNKVTCTYIAITNKKLVILLKGIAIVPEQDIEF